MSNTRIIYRENEQQWLTERRNYVTATDIGRLANGGAATFAAVKAEKQGASTFHGNKYTKWGRERELMIMGYVNFLYDIPPNDALYVSSEGRAATPDGINDTMLAEVKTTVTDWWRGNQPDTLEVIRAQKPQYYDQVQWAQLVCDRDVTIFAWEPHEQFVPGEIQHIEIPRDNQRIAELIEVEARFREYWETDQDNDEWYGFLARYAEAEAQAAEAQAKVEALKTELRERQGDQELSVKLPIGSISYTWPKPRETFDTTTFKKTHPELVKQFTKLTPAKTPTLRITTK